MKVEVFSINGNIKDKDTCSVKFCFSEQIKDCEESLNLKVDFDKDGNIISFPALELKQLENPNYYISVGRFVEDILKFEEKCAKKICKDALEIEDSFFKAVSPIVGDVKYQKMIQRSKRIEDKMSSTKEETKTYQKLKHQYVELVGFKMAPYDQKIRQAKLIRFKFMKKLELII